jgi:hypothetical protein
VSQRIGIITALGVMRGGPEGMYLNWEDISGGVPKS